MSNVNMDRRGFLAGSIATGAAVAALSGVQAAFADAPADAPAAEGSIDFYAAALGEGMRSLPVADKGWPLFEDHVAPVAYEARQIGDDEITAQDDCDVLVIGCGVGGTIAALKAASEGAKVIACEKGQTGRDLWESVGGLGTSSMKSKGYEPSPAAYVDAIVRGAGFRCRQEVVWSFANNSGEAIDFMQEMLSRSSDIIVEATGIGDTLSEHTFLNTGSDGILLGPYVMPALFKSAEEFDNLELRFETAGVQLVQGEDGAVTGAIVKDMNTGAYSKINAAKGVILATGGYEMNPQMVMAWCRPEDYAFSSLLMTHALTAGDGHMMGLAVGAGIDPLPHCTMTFCGSYPQNGGLFHPFRYAIHINARGERFVDETLMFNYAASAMNTNAMRGGVWCVFDQSLVDTLSEAYGDDLMESTVKPFMEAGWLFEAPSIEELAGIMGVDAERLAGTIEKWNGYFEADPPEDLEYMRPLDDAQPITTAPYYAMIINSSLLVTVAGLIIDPESRVLDKFEKPIPGLYAVGNTSGGMFADQYPRNLPAVSVGRAVTQGYVAARTATA